MRSVLKTTHYMKDYDIGPEERTYPPEYDEEFDGEEVFEDDDIDEF